MGEIQDHVALGLLLFAMQLRKQERKGVKGLLLVGHEKVLHGFELTGDHGSNTARGDGA